MNNEKQKYYIRPEGGNGSNTIADILKIIVWCVWIGGAFLGVYLGYTAGRVSSMVSYYISGRSGSDFSFGTMLITWAVAFLLGLFPYAFAEIITLLQRLNNMTYSVEISGNGVAYQTDNEPQKSMPGTDRTNEPLSLPLENSDSRLPFKLSRLEVNNINLSQTGISLTILPSSKTLVEVEAILADLIVTPKVGNTYTFSDIAFTDFKWDGNKRISIDTVCDITKSMTATIRFVEVEVKQYAVKGKTYTPDDNAFKEEGEDHSEKIESLMNAVRSMSNAYEIRSYVEGLAIRGHELATPKLRKMIGEIADTERLYGNRKKECINKLEEYFGLPHYDSGAGETDDLDIGSNAEMDKGEGIEEKSEITKVDTIEKAVDEKEASEEMATEERADVQEASNSTAIAAPAFCINCGTKIETPDSLFCPNCGTKIVR